MTTSPQQTPRGKNPGRGRFLKLLAGGLWVACIVLGVIAFANKDMSFRLAMAVPFFATLFGAILLQAQGDRHLAPGAEELLASDPRGPIVYLRSFGIDAANAFEGMIVDVLGEVGPPVAIGKPGERLPPEGFARLYVGDDRWQDRVLDLLARAQLVLVAPGETAGLSWELQQCRAQLDPARMLILVTRNRKAYEAFTLTARDSAGLVLPAWPGDKRQLVGDLTGFVAFDRNWSSRFVPFKSAYWQGSSITSQDNDRFRLALGPLCTPLGINVRQPGRPWFRIGVLIYLLIVVVAAAIGLYVAYQSGTLTF